MRQKRFGKVAEQQRVKTLSVPNTVPLAHVGRYARRGSERHLAGVFLDGLVLQERAGVKVRVPVATFQPEFPV
jgi:hypothetical protein